MSEIPSDQILCRHCTAPLTVPPGSQFVICGYCQTTNYLDKSQVVLHYVVRETVRPSDAEANLRRWMAGNATVKDLDNKATLEGATFELFPMWMVRAQKDGAEQVVMEPAAALSVSELKGVKVPASALEPFDYSTSSPVVTATVPYNTMRQWLATEHQIQPDQIRELSLVHLPIYHCKYRYQNQRYTAVVDGATGQVFANLFPSKWEAPYQTLGILAFLIYFIAAVAIAILIGPFEGAAIYCGLSLLIALPIFLVAAYISAKV